MDTRIFYDINDFARHTPWLHPVVSGYAEYGVLLFAGLLLAAWWIARGDSRSDRMVAALWAPLGTLAALAINQPIAAAINETRPCQALHDIVVMHCSTDPGLPSDHAVMVGAVTAGTWLVCRRLGVLAAAAAVVMAFARVYIGAHYPQDVVAGVVLGAVVVLAGHRLLRRVLQRLLTVIADTPLRVLVIPSASKPVDARTTSQ